MNLTARIATRFRASGARLSDATYAAVTPAAAPSFVGAGAPSVRRSRVRIGATAAATLAAFLLASSGQALATTGHTFAGSFGGPGEAEGEFLNGLHGVAVMPSTGDVFTLSGETGLIQDFSGAGVFASSFGVDSLDPVGAVAVDPAGGGAVYILGFAGTAEVLKYSASGDFAYPLDASSSGTTIGFSGGGVSAGNPGLAVDPVDGVVYVLATENVSGAQVIDSFSQSTGAFIASFNGESGSPDGGFVCPSGLAVDPTHHVYVLEPCKGTGRVDKYSAAGVYEATVDDGSRGAPQAVATDPTSGEVYVAEAGPSGLQITEFSAGGASVTYTFAVTNVEVGPGLPLSMAVGPDGTVYVADNATDNTNSLVDRFTPFEGPTVVTEPATEAQTTTATFNGTVDAEGVPSEYRYEYGLDTTYGSSTALVAAGSGNTADAAPAEVSGLVPNTTYHFRIVGTNASGAITGADQEFSTPPAPPHVDGSPAYAATITPTGARIHATINPEHSFTLFHFEYGTSTAYGSSAPEGLALLGFQSTDQPVTEDLTGLEPDTLYHFRISAQNGVEPSPQTGADATFFTAPAEPASVDELTTAKATLTGTVNPHGAPTTYHFNYGPGIAYGASTPETSAGSGDGDQSVSEHISGLHPGTTYHVQVVATTNGISSSGADATFTTAPAPAAFVSDPTAVTTSSATLQGAADTHGLAGSFHFLLTATAGSFSLTTPEQPLPAAVGSQPLSVPVSGLPSGQGFQVRLIVSSNEASETSALKSFATAEPPPEGFPAPPLPASLYGCSTPHLNPFNGRPGPGATIAISGSDLGLAGSVLLGEDTLIPTGWSAAGFTIEVPADAAGTLGLTVNCGHASNTIAIATSVAVKPNNAFSVQKTGVRGSSATLTLSLPGPGTLRSSGARTKATSTTVAKTGTVTVRIALSRVGLKALRKSKRRTLPVKVQLRFTPTGGQTATHTATLTFKRTGSR